MPATKVESVMTGRMGQINREMIALLSILDALQERAECCVSEIQNRLQLFDGEGLPDEVRARFKRLERLFCCV